MRYTAHWQKYTLNFKKPSGTSRGILTEKDCWFILLKSEETQSISGIGECAPLAGLSVDNLQTIEDKLTQVCANINLYLNGGGGRLNDYPSIQFAIDCLARNLVYQNPNLLFKTAFTEGESYIPINGLIWMGDIESMFSQIQQKLDDGFSCIKLKIGAVNFDDEMTLLKNIRKKYSAEALEIRVDANGAFTKQDVFFKLEQLAKLNIHSIEQPIKQGQLELLAKLCANPAIPIALDEELIGKHSQSEMESLLSAVKPQYIILKPTLLGGFSKAQQWIDIVERYNIGWWLTSALESNIGLNAIAQWTASLNTKMPQGLGTGQLFTNNIESPLYLQQDRLWFDKNNNLNS